MTLEVAVFMWALAILMAGAIALGPVAVYVVLALTVAYAVYAVS